MTEEIFVYQPTLRHNHLNVKRLLYCKYEKPCNFKKPAANSGAMNGYVRCEWEGRCNQQTFTPQRRKNVT